VPGGISTGGGDHGHTSLGDGRRVRKDDARVEAYGTVDEAAAAIGLARTAVRDAPLDLTLAFAQQRLLNVASLLATPGTDGPRVTEEDAETLERAAADLLDAAGGFTGFVLPGGSETASRLHVARTVVRRAERRVVSLSSAEDVDPAVLRFLNRLSDTLYAAARYANTIDGVDEDAWNAGFEPPDAPVRD
jgi:cob(I)alamin adenosyltransferase